MVEEIDEAGEQTIETDPAGIDLFTKDLPPRSEMEEAEFATTGEEGDKRPLFDKKDILTAVHETMRAARATGDSAQVFTAEESDAWQQWFNETPGSLQAVPSEQRAKFELPTHGYKATAPLASAPRRQMELLRHESSTGRYSNVDHRHAGEDADQRPLTAGDVVAVKRSAVPTVDAPGWNTPFYLALIISISDTDCDEPSSSSDTPGCARELVVHWMAPFDGATMSNDINKQWALLCHGQHKWKWLCDKRKKCSGGKWTERIPVSAIGADGIQFTAARKIASKSQKALARASSVLCEKGTTLTYKSGMLKMTADDADDSSDEEETMGELHRRVMQLGQQKKQDGGHNKKATWPSNDVLFGSDEEG